MKKTRFILINTQTNVVLVNTVDKQAFIDMVQKAFIENEPFDTCLRTPTTVQQAQDYITIWCRHLEWFSKKTFRY